MNNMVNILRTRVSQSDLGAMVQEGDKIRVVIDGETIIGIVEQIDNHKGEMVFELEGKGRYAYSHQIKEIIK